MRLVLIVLLLLATGADDAYARTKRSQSAKVEFKQEHPCPATGARKGPCKGYVIDHVNPLACGGADRPENMQWADHCRGEGEGQVGTPRMRAVTTRPWMAVV